MAEVQTPQEKAEERKARLQALKAKRTASEREKAICFNIQICII